MGNKFAKTKKPESVVIAMYSYNATNEGDVSFRKG
jgi:hypothetical protein